MTIHVNSELNSELNMKCQTYFPRKIVIIQNLDCHLLQFCLALELLSFSELFQQNKLRTICM